MENLKLKLQTTKPEVVEITPAMAGEILAKTEEHRSNPRAVRDGHVGYLIRKMEAGVWLSPGPDPILLDGNGGCRDGRHRLRAVAKFGKPFKFYVFQDAPVEWVQHAGDPMPRRPSDRACVIPDNVPANEFAVELCNIYISLRIRNGRNTVNEIEDIGKQFGDTLNRFVAKYQVTRTRRTFGRAAVALALLEGFALFGESINEFADSLYCTDPTDCKHAEQVKLYLGNRGQKGSGGGFTSRQIDHGHVVCGILRYRYNSPIKRLTCADWSNENLRLLPWLKGYVRVS